MRRTPLLFVLPASLWLSGCGYVHVGPAPAPVTQMIRDESLSAENAVLQQEKAGLLRELSLTRAQGEALRAALQNRAADGETSKRLVDQLNEATRELAQLRSSYAQLQSESAKGKLGDAPALQARLTATEERLAASLRNYTELQDEVGRLRRDLARTRAENISLAQQLRTVTGQYERAQAALAQLNPELLAQKDARGRAEQDTLTVRPEPKSALAPAASSLSSQRVGTATEARVLSAPAADAKPAAKAEAPVAAATAPKAISSAVNVSFVSKNAPAPLILRNSASGDSRLHVVASGDTLAKISTRYYGTPSRWSDILTANRDILGETNNLVIGRTLRIP